MLHHVQSVVVVRYCCRGLYDRTHKIEIALSSLHWERRGLYDRIRLKPIGDDKVGTFAQKQSAWLHKIETKVKTCERDLRRVAVYATAKN